MCMDSYAVVDFTKIQQILRNDCSWCNSNVTFTFPTSGQIGVDSQKVHDNPIFTFSKHKHLNVLRSPSTINQQLFVVWPHRICRRKRYQHHETHNGATRACLQLLRFCAYLGNDRKGTIEQYKKVQSGSTIAPGPWTWNFHIFHKFDARKCVMKYNCYIVSLKKITCILFYVPTERLVCKAESHEYYDVVRLFYCDFSRELVVYICRFVDPHLTDELNFIEDSKTKIFLRHGFTPETYLYYWSRFKRLMFNKKLSRSEFGRRLLRKI